MTAPAVFLGTQPGFLTLPSIDLFNLLEPVGQFPAGSTVSRQTLESHGYRVAYLQPASRRQDSSRPAVVITADRRWAGAA